MVVSLILSTVVCFLNVSGTFTSSWWYSSDSDRDSDSSELETWSTSKGSSSECSSSLSFW